MTGGVLHEPDVIEVVHVLIPSAVATCMVYAVVALLGGITENDPPIPTRRFPGLRTPVCAFTRVHEIVDPLPSETEFGEAVIEHRGGSVGGGSVVVPAVTLALHVFDPAVLLTCIL